MKAYTKTAVLVVLPLLLLTRCDSLLETEPLGTLTEDTFYQTPEHFASATLGAYSTLTNIWSAARGGPHYLQMIEWPTDDYTNKEGSNNFEEFVWTPSNGAAKDELWGNLYKGVLRSNTVLDRLPDAAEVPDAQKAEFAGQAKFLRAWFYFLLTRLYGNVPLVTEPITNLANVNKGNADQDIQVVWDLIEQDLSEAMTELPPRWPEEAGRATSGAAQALLGKVQLYRAQWFDQSGKYAEAEQNLQAVVNSGEYSLTNEFAANFRLEFENNEESLFEIQFSRGDFNPWLYADWAYEVGGNVGSASTGRIVNWYPGSYQGNSPPGSGSGNFPATQCLADAFEESDPRAERTFFDEGDPIANTTFKREWSPTGMYPAKYVFPLLEDADGVRLTAGENNERDIRFADVLLMLAEAEIHVGQLGEAAMHINQVRERARDNWEIVFPDSARPASLLPPIESSDAQTMQQQLMHERRVELSGEAHRWHDLVRWHRAGIQDITSIDFCNTLANQNIQERHILRPIPQNEIDLVGPENLVQNPGY